LSRLAILTSGGDAPGMNAAIRAATVLAHARGHEVLGVEAGYRGLIAGAFRPLGPDEVGSILREGGTILGSARCRAFEERAGRDEARARLRQAGADALLVIGGNGSLTGARLFAAEGDIRVAGVPASIDNDVGLTAMAIGVDTAMNTIVEACDKISDTATAHGRTFIVEVMGRDCGYLAMSTAIAAGADAVLFRESGKSEAELVDAVVETIRRARAHRAHRRVLVIKAEGVGISSERLKREVDARLAPEADGLHETRVTVLGHIVRGGRPSAFDRLLASRLARVGVEALLAGETGVMAAWAPPGTLPGAGARPAPTDPHCWIADLDAVLAETRRILDGSSPVAKWRVRVFDELEDVLRL
jgi:6-phosphofructokinase 1